MKKTTLAVLLSLASMSGFSAELNHQGTLTNSNSQEPVEGTFNVTFSLYDEELLLWQSIRNVEFIAGVYQINLGSVNPINESIFSRSNINLGIKIEDDTEMSPRLSIDTFPKAYHAKVASSVKGQVDASSIFVAGEMIINEFGEWVGSPSGLEGKAGVDGKDGVNGLDGKDGVNGLDGKDGVNGLDGKDGVNGLDGKDGVNGLDGKDGINGLDGKSGFESKGLWDQNSQYIKNDFVTYQGSVFIALNNLQSSSESLTPKLDSSNWQLLVSKGDKGLDGKNGVDGIAGKDGLDGKNGVDGIAGKDGLDGKNGVDGIAGKDGLAGKNGVDGTAGKDGLDGTNGVDGIAGKDGKDGLRFRGVWDQNTEYVKNDFVTYQGNTYITLNNLQSDNESKMPELDSQNWKLFVAKGDKGLDGKDGIAGRDGTNGSNGKDGIAGIDGANGLDGKDGIAGKDGANGLDGKDGIAGKD
ncbi:Carbohydrate binding domain-containing protein, partial [Pseudoalteromonas denitrificans DSM 6059]